MKLKYWLWLTQISYIGVVTANKLMDCMGDPQVVFEADEKTLRQTGILNKRQLRSIVENHDMVLAETIINNCRTLGISIMTKADTCYPDRAKYFDDAPIVLYYKGTPGRKKRAVGIVGARRCTQETKKQVIKIISQYVSKGYSIISGMAKGVDSYAHTVAINNDGYTVAIVGDGLDICYPSEHDKLMQKIQNKGLLLSEYPPGTIPARCRFPQRNRLISAWSDEIVVIGAGKGSGAFITADYGDKYGHKVLYM